MAKIRRTDPVAELLGTNNKKEQAAAIQQLAQLANAPFLTLVITFDSRTQMVDANQVGGKAPNEILQQILDAAKNLFNQQEIAKRVQLAKQEVPDGSHGGFAIPVGPESLQDIPTNNIEEHDNAEQDSTDI